MPILKQLVSSSNQSKRRSRTDLTAEMISAPLGDFRHTMHVGRGGDAFGDTSFLSTRSGEPPREPHVKQDSPGSKPGLLSRTFRSSKRSHSVNRGDKYQYALAPSGGSSNYVKTAISLPYLNDEDSNRRPPLPKSVSSSPTKRLPAPASKPANGAAALATLDPELEERSFGQLTDLPPPMPKGGGMKHAESMMSFHIDLAPSTLGDILSVMEKESREDDDLGYEEGKSPTPAPIPLMDEGAAPARPPRSAYQQTVPHPPQLLSRTQQRPDPDSCSVSSSGSTPEEKPPYRLALASDGRDFTFMDEDEDEIRV